MSDVVIRVENVSKAYRLGLIGGGTLHGDLSRWWARVSKKPDPFAKIGAPGQRPSDGEVIWALSDVSLDVRKGEILGIIGGNGAGKSTLLKILSRVTAPTTGVARLKGRIGSLLEVGTGFHPELTGRENIYLNGAMLGMSRRETARRFDEIVEFAEIADFIDTPVKRYSSGMYVRLAFAVAAHIDPDILVVDEVLAVGDAAFQRKCIGTMGNATRSGRTVLIVSHNMATIETLCNRCILLKQGRIVAEGDAPSTIRTYLESAEAAVDGQVALTDHPNRLPGMAPYLTLIRLLNASEQMSNTFLQGEPIVIELTYDGRSCPEPLAGLGMNVTAASGARVGGFNTYMAKAPPHSVPKSGTVRFRIDGPCLTPGAYWVSVSLGSHPAVLVDRVDYALGFVVTPRDVYGTGYLLTPEDGVAAFYCHVELKESADSMVRNGA